MIQVSSDDAQTQKLALNNAVNLQKAYGMDNVQFEVVAYGPGRSIFTGKRLESSRVPSLSQQDIKFSACGNTMDKIKRKSGELPQLVEGVEGVPAGVQRIVELQEEGYADIRP